MTAETPDDDFARFRAERLAKRRPTRPSPASGIPFFGTDRKARTQIRNMEGQERASLDDLQGLEPAEPDQTASPRTTSEPKPVRREARTPRPAPASPRPRPRSAKLRSLPAQPQGQTPEARPTRAQPNRAQGPRTAPRGPVAGAARPAASSPPRGAPRRAENGAAAPLVGAPAGKPAPRACPPTALERPRRPGLVVDPPLPPRRPAPEAVAEEPKPRPAPGSRDRRAELPPGSADPMERVVQMSHREAARAERKTRFRKHNSPEDLAPKLQPEKPRVYRQYSTSRRVRRAAQEERAQSS